MRETEDVIDEQEHVGAGRVAKVFGHRQGRQGDTQTRAGRFVHLTENHARLLHDAAARVADLGFLHFDPQVGPLARPLADAGEYRVAAVGAGDPGDELGEDHGLPQSGAAEQARFSAADEWRQKIDDLDACLEQLGLGRQIRDRRGVAMDRPALLGIDGTAIVDRLANQVEHPTQRGLSDRDLHGVAGIDAFLTANHTVGTPQSDAADASAAQVLLYFADEVYLHALLLRLDADGVVNRRRVVLRELDVKRRADDLRDVADILGRVFAFLAGIGRWWPFGTRCCDG